MTYFKICPECEKKCFSASRFTNWICPYCDEDIDGVEIYSISELDEAEDDERGTGHGRSRQNDTYYR